MSNRTTHTTHATIFGMGTGMTALSCTGTRFYQCIATSRHIAGHVLQRTSLDARAALHTTRSRLCCVTPLVNVVPLPFYWYFSIICSRKVSATTTQKQTKQPLSSLLRANAFRLYSSQHLTFVSFSFISLAAWLGHRQTPLFYFPLSYPFFKYHQQWQT
eukprot:m.246265 g.246265  ORF g.246265 m.246265 type:complete len:159 (-) comp15376_c0_seq2:5580-6056(-)